VLSIDAVLLKTLLLGGRHSTAVAFSLHVPAGPGLIPSVPEIFSIDWGPTNPVLTSG